MLEKITLSMMIIMSLFCFIVIIIKAVKDKPPISCIAIDCFWLSVCISCVIIAILVMGDKI